MTSKLYHIFLLLACLLTSCVSQTKMLQLMNQGIKLTSTNPDPNLFVNHVVTEVESSDIKGIRQWPQVRQQNFRCIPLVFFTNWKSAYNCEIGLRDVEQNLKPNFEAALKRKFSNSELFQHKIALDSLDYTLEVSVDTIQSNLPFVSKGTIIFALVAYSYWTFEGVEDSFLSLSTSYRFSKNGSVLKEGTVKTKRMVAAGENNRGSKKKYMQQYLTNYFGEMNVLLEHNATEIINRLETGS